MKAIMLMFDTLNRHMLEPYGCTWTHTPNFTRLAQHTVTFDNSYIGSMPCMPARRELHTGRYNFLHRSWSPLEPFDDSVTELLQRKGIYTHLCTDHPHYWEDGGCTYHPRYNTFDLVRGQEGDKWKGVVKTPEHYETASQKKVLGRQDAINRMYMQKEKDHPQTRTLDAATEFITTNHDSDNWFLQIETFDPHEPFFTYDEYKKLYPHDFRAFPSDWPTYGRNNETKEMEEHLRYCYASLVSMCDHSLGRVLDLMDQYNLWEDTLLIVNTDHGFLLGEHDFWGKNAMPYYNETAHTPLFIWDPRSKKQNERRSALVQTIDLPLTLLEYFGVPATSDMQGHSLAETIASDKPVREAGLFGIFGGHICCTDGKYVYMRGAKDRSNKPLFQYTLMPTHMRGRFTVEELQTAELAKPFSFTKGCPLVKTRCAAWGAEQDPYGLDGYCYPDQICENMLFNLESDPGQLRPIHNQELEKRMIALMITLMEKNDAPEEQYIRTGLDQYRRKKADI